MGAVGVRRRAGERGHTDGRRAHGSNRAARALHGAFRTLHRSQRSADQIQQFCKELLRDEKRTVGRLDSRIKGIRRSAASEHPDFDASMAAIRPPYTAVFNHYVRTQLGYKSDLPYHILGGGISEPWQWGRGTGLHRYQRGAPQRLCQKPVHETVRCFRLL